MNALRDALHDLADEARPADLAPRVAAGLRRRRARRTAVATALATVAVAAGAVVTSGVRAAREEPTAPAADVRYDAVWVTAEYPAPEREVRRLHGLGADGRVRDLGILPATGYDLSPDGRRLVYLEAELRYREVTVRTLGTGGTQRYPVGAGIAAYTVPTWSADGRGLAFCYEHVGARGRPERRGFALLDTVTGLVARVPRPVCGGLSWSPDGERLAVQDPEGNGFEVVTATGRRIADMRHDGWWLRSGHAWSPDGTRILVAVAGGDEHTLVVNAETAGTVALLPENPTEVWYDDHHLVGRSTSGEPAFAVRALDGDVVDRRRPLPVPPDASGLRLRPAS